MSMKVTVTKENVLITQADILCSGEIGVNECLFSLPDFFDGLKVTAFFNNIPVPVLNGKCTIPSLSEGTATLGVYAYSDTEDGITLMYSPEPTVFYVSKGSFSEDINSEATAELSVYEQYCNMIKSEYEELESSVNQKEQQRDTAEATRQEAEATRQATFEQNEEIRQATFDTNEQIRSSSVNGRYTNLLGGIAEENSTTVNPTQFPAHKINVMYEGSWAFKFLSESGYESYIFEAQEGDRFNFSGYNVSSASARSTSIVVLDSNFGVLQNLPTAVKVLGLCSGISACPENTAYIVINKAIDGNVPVVTKVDEPVISTVGGFVPNASKCSSRLYHNSQHAAYYGNVGEALSCSFRPDTVLYSFSGIYPLESGKEYILYAPESEEYADVGYLCNEGFLINTKVHGKDLDANNRYRFVATDNDKYVALNCYSFDTVQFGESVSNKIRVGSNIGDAFYDGKSSLSLEEIGVVNRNLSDKKWIAYGDSITLGVGINYANGIKRWTDYVVDRYKIGSHINMGEGMTCIGYVEMSDTYSGRSMCRDDRLGELIAEAPDIVTILGGANDYYFNIPIGTDEDVTNKNIYTFKGAYAYIIDKLLTAKPYTTILLLGMFTNALGNYAPNESKPYQISEYAQATKEIAEHFGLPFIDLNECGFNSYNFNTTDGVFSTDGIHPNAEGTKRIAMVVSKWFDTFKGTVY